MATYVVCTSLAAGLGLALNSYALGVLLWGHGRLQTPNNLLLLHLACVDIAFCLLVLAGNASAPSGHEIVDDDASDSKHNDGAACRAQGYAWASLPVLILWSVCALSCDRYAAITSPLHYTRLVSRGRAGTFLLASWMVGASLAVPPLVVGQDASTHLGPCPYRYCKATLSCRPDCTSALPADIVFAILYVGLGALLPLTVVLACSWRVLLIAHSHRSRIVSALYQVAVRASSVAAPSPSRSTPLYRGKSALWTTSQLVASLVALCVPFFGGMLWEAATGVPSHSVYLSVSAALLTLAPPANAYVYGIRSRVLRRTLRHLVNRYLCKRQALRDVQVCSRRSSLAARRYSAPAIISTPNTDVVFPRTSVFTRSLRTHREFERDSLFCRRASLLCWHGSLQLPRPDISVHISRCDWTLKEESGAELSEDQGGDNLDDRAVPSLDLGVGDSLINEMDRVGDSAACEKFLSAEELAGEQCIIMDNSNQI